jgi:hypothetical protein
MSQTTPNVYRNWKKNWYYFALIDYLSVILNCPLSNSTKKTNGQTIEQSQYCGSSNFLWWNILLFFFNAEPKLINTLFTLVSVSLWCPLFHL